jgi:hypothetical protein
MPCSSLTRKLFENTEHVWDVIVGVLNHMLELEGDHAWVLNPIYCSPKVLVIPVKYQT